MRSFSGLEWDVAGVGERAFCEGEHLGGFELVDPCRASCGVPESFVVDLVVPAAVPLVGPGGGEAFEQCAVVDALGATLDDDVDAAVPGVAPGGEQDLIVVGEVVRLLLA
jgi:hypothetical protein